MLVLAQQQRLMGNGQVDELLVVGVAAGDAGFGGDFGDSGVLVKGDQHVFRRQLVELQARDDLRIGQHTGEFVAHRLRGQPLDFAGQEGLLQWRRRRIVKHEHIQNNVRVED